MRLKIRTKLILSLAIPLTATFLFISLLDFRSSAATALAAARERAAERAGTVALQIDGRLRAIMQLADSYATSISSTLSTSAQGLARVQSLAAALLAADDTIVSVRVLFAFGDPRSPSPPDAIDPLTGVAPAPAARQLLVFTADDSAAPRPAQRLDPGAVDWWTALAAAPRPTWITLRPDSRGTAAARRAAPRQVMTYLTPVTVQQRSTDLPAVIEVNLSSQRLAELTSVVKAAEASGQGAASTRRPRAQRAAGPDVPEPEIPDAVASALRGLGDRGFAIIDNDGRLVGSSSTEDRIGVNIFDLARRGAAAELLAIEQAVKGQLPPQTPGDLSAVRVGRDGVVVRVSALRDNGQTRRTAAGSQTAAGIRDEPHWVVLTPIPAAGLWFITAFPESEVTQPILSRLATTGGLLLLGLAITGAVILLVAVRLSRPIESLALAAGSVAAGDLDQKVPEPAGGDEVATLARGFNRMTGRLRHQMQALADQTAAREAMESELRIARRIQQDLLPRTFPPFPDRTEFDLHASNIPARHVAGDFYDFFFTPSGDLLLVVADVSGKGVPASLLMAVTRTVIRNLAAVELSPMEIIRRTNQTLLRDSSSEMFVTLFLGLYSPQTGRLRYINAGHPPPVLRSAAAPLNPCEIGPPTAPLLGIMDEDAWGGFAEAEITLQPGDTLLAFSDGLTEAHRPGSGDLFGIERLLAAVADAPADADAQALCESAAAASLAFQTAPADDLTVLALKRRT